MVLCQLALAHEGNSKGGECLRGLAASFLLLVLLLAYLLDDLLGIRVYRSLPHGLDGLFIEVALPLHYQEVCILPCHLLLVHGPLDRQEVARVHLVLTLLGVFHVVWQLVVSTPEKGVQALVPERLSLKEFLIEHVELPLKLGLGSVCLLLS